MHVLCRQSDSNRGLKLFRKLGLQNGLHQSHRKSPKISISMIPKDTSKLLLKYNRFGVHLLPHKDSLAVYGLDTRAVTKQNYLH